MRRQHQIKTEIQRNKLKPRTAIYWNIVSPGHAIGIRRYQLGFAWCCRNGAVHTFRDSGHWTYDEALQMITEFWAQESASAASYTVEQAIRDYANHQRIRKGIRAEIAADRTCSRPLSGWLNRELSSITKSELSELHESWVKAGSADKVRASKASANRTLATCKACFNLAYRNGHVEGKAWEFVTAFPKVDGSRDLLLSSDELQRLLDATSGAFHNLVKVAILTGARIGELRSARVGDLDSGKLSLDGKTGHRLIPLRSDALAFITSLVSGKQVSDPLLPADDGRAWKAGSQSRLMQKAVKAAGIDPAAVFYSIRHAFISSAVRDGIPILAVSQYTGTSVAMIEKTYGKFQPDNMQALFDGVSI